MFKIISFSLFFLISVSLKASIIPEGAFSKDARGLTTANFLSNISSPKLSAMGETGMIVSSPDNFFYNPSSMDSIKKYSVYINYQSLLLSSNRTDLSFLWKKENRVSGFGLIYNSYGTFEENNIFGEKIGTFSPNDFVLIYGFSKRNKYSSYGINFKFINTDLVYEKANSFAIDLGFNSYANNKIDEKADYSILIRNFGLPMKINSKEEPLPLEIIAGFKYPYKNLNFNGEAKFPVNNKPYIASGFELLFPFTSLDFVLRGGVNLKNISELGFLSCISMGFGFAFNSLSFDYAYLPKSDLGNIHKLSMTYFWGKENKENKKYIDNYKESFLKEKKFAIVPFLNKSSIKIDNYGYLLSSSLQEKLLRFNFSLPDKESLEYAKVEEKLNFKKEYYWKDFCQNLNVSYCIYGKIIDFKKEYKLIINIYNMQENRNEKIMLVNINKNLNFLPAITALSQNINSQIK